MNRQEHQARRQQAIDMVKAAGTAGVRRDVLMQITGITQTRSFTQSLHRMREAGLADLRPKVVDDGLRYFTAECVPSTAHTVKPYVKRAMEEKRAVLVEAGKDGLTTAELRRTTGWATFHRALCELKSQGRAFFRKGNKHQPGRYFAFLDYLQADEIKRPPAVVKRAVKKSAKALRIVPKKPPAPVDVFKTAEPIYPPGLQVTICPTGIDTRFTAVIPPGGGVITRDWRERRLMEAA